MMENKVDNWRRNAKIEVACQIILNKAKKNKLFPKKIIKQKQEIIRKIGKRNTEDFNEIRYGKS